MNQIQKVAGLAIIAALSVNLGAASATLAQTPAAAPAGQEAKPQYTMAEYNAYQAAAAEKNPATQVKALDDFATKYPNSALMIYIYPLYYQAYSQLKNYQKVIEYADKLVALGDKIDAGARYQALYARAFAYNAIVADPAQAKTGATDAALAKTAMAAAVAGLKALDEVKKPEAMTDDAFATQKKQIQIYFNGTAAQAAMVQKDNASAITYYKAVLELNPDDAITSYRLGLAYMATTPPQQMDAFWSIARAVTAKGATQAQSTKVKEYLRKLMVNYQQAACDNLTDAELNELLQLAGSSPTRPDSYKLPSADDLTAARKDMTMRSVIDDLKAGGDKAKVTWLSACGLEFPEVPGKVIEVTPGADVQLKVAFVTSEAEFDAATTPNLDVKVVGQPDAGKLEKDSAVHFTGTLVAFDPDPAFMLHWDKAKVKEEDLPKANAPAKKPAARRPAAKKPTP
jgi:tetratricopeptide (TPR) repeat protein